jgi:hypothetical protein
MFPIRVLLCLLALLSLVDIGLQLHLRRQLMAREPVAAASAGPAAPAVPTTRPAPGTVDPALVGRLLENWPWRPDGTMPPR